jgi:hypothetical protein
MDCEKSEEEKAAGSRCLGGPELKEDYFVRKLFNIFSKLGCSLPKSWSGAMKTQ